MLHCVRNEFAAAVLCLIGCLGVCSLAGAEVNCPQTGCPQADCPQAGPCWGPCASCPGHYPCVPNAANYGYFHTLWRPWPTESRPDQTFPQSIGREALPTPPGEEPEPLPRVKVEDIQPVAPESPGMGAPIEGVPAEPGMQSPLQPAPGGALPGLPLESALPSLDAIPQMDTAPGGNQNAPAENTPLLPDTNTPNPLQMPGTDDGGRIDRDGYRELLLSDSSTLPVLPTAPLHGEPALAKRDEPALAKRDEPALAKRDEPALTKRDEPVPVKRELTPAERDPVSEKIAEERAAPPKEEQVPAEPESRPEPKPLALDGYCPVELIENQAWTLGDQRWSAEHDGVLYRFAKEAHMNRFMEEPGRYIPVKGGKDPVLLMQENKTISGRTDFCAIYKNRLYMFSSRESLTAFRQNPKKYVSPVIRR